MERKKLEMDQQKWKAIQNYADNSKGLIGAWAGYTYYRYGGNWNLELWKALGKLYSKPISQLSAKEFLCRDLENAFTTLAGKEMAEKIPYIIAMRLEGQFSSSPWRRSYRSKYFAFYAESIVELLCQLIPGHVGVFQNVMEQSRLNGLGVQTQFLRNDLCHGQRMDDIGFAALSLLAAVGFVRHLESGADLGKICSGIIASYGFYQ